MLEAGKTSEEKEHLNLIGDDENASAFAVVEYDIQHPSLQAAAIRVSLSLAKDMFEVKRLPKYLTVVFELSAKSPWQVTCSSPACTDVDPPPLPR